MYITGISDEAGKPIEDQIRAHRELGWTRMEVRNVQIAGSTHGPGNLHNISDEDFAAFERAIKDAGMEVVCFASMVANGKRKMHEPFDSTLDEARRAIARMKILGTRMIRIMSFGIRWDSDDQMPAERFRRLRILVAMLQDAGITALHENCGNYAGMGWTYTQELLSEVPGIRLVFDTGNPVFSDDRSKPRPWPKQSSWEYYNKVRAAIDYVHIKDAVWKPELNRETYCFPGEGQGDVERIVSDLLRSGYDGGFSIEPHMGGSYATYVEYGQRFEQLLRVQQAAGVA